MRSLDNNMRVYPILLILVVAASTVSRSPADEPDDVPSTSISATSDDAADAGRVRLLFLSQERPIRIDVLVKIGEQSIETRWRKGAEALFARLDKDGNKQLDTVEYRRAPWVSSTQTKRGNDVFSLFLRGVADRLQDRRKKTEKALDLSAFVKQMRTHRPPFVVEASPKVSPGKELFQWLDENGDNRLDAMELDRMEAVVARLDRNRDRALQAAELDQFKNPFSLQQQSMIMTSERQSNMVHVVDAATDRLAVQILDRYADNKDSIDAAWFGVDAVGHDEDGDKRLDVNELVN